MNKGNKVIGYVRGSTDEQGSSRPLLDAQRRAIRGECKRRGWRLLRIEEDIADAMATNNRPGLERALAACAAGEAQGLAVAKLDYLTRSLLDFASLVQRAQREGFDLVVVEQGFDLSTSHGRALADMLVVFAQYERELISEQIKAGLAVVRKTGTKSGRPIGRPRALPADVRARIRRLHRAGNSYSEIARKLNAEAVPTAHGGTWHASTVRTIVSSY